MNQTRMFGLACVLSLSLATAAAAQEQIDGMAILKKVQDTYTSMKTFQAEGRLVTTLSSPTVLIGGSRLIPQTSETAFTIALVQPDKLRVENQDAEKGSLKIWHGKALWTYTPKLNEYSQADVSTAAGAREKASALEDFDSFRGNYKNLLQGVKSAEALREESLQVNGHDVGCYVLRVERKGSGKPLTMKSGTTFEVDPAETIWIDKSRFLVLKKRSGTVKSSTSGPLGMEFDFDSTVYFEKAAADEPVSDELFDFVPPAGATRIVRKQSQSRPQPPKPH
jgi:outer membrane lipoprotein-sorting protein